MVMLIDYLKRLACDQWKSAQLPGYEMLTLAVVS